MLSKAQAQVAFFQPPTLSMTLGRQLVSNFILLTLHNFYFINHMSAKRFEQQKHQMIRKHEHQRNLNTLYWNLYYIYKDSHIYFYKRLILILPTVCVANSPIKLHKHNLNQSIKFSDALMQFQFSVEIKYISPPMKPQIKTKLIINTPIKYKTSIYTKSTS